MRTNFRLSDAPAGNRPGLALVIVISLLAMLAAVTVALLVVVDHSTQRTAGELHSRQSEDLAHSAFATILSDLADEMEKGSSGTTVHELDDGTVFRQHDLSGSREGLRVARSLRPGWPDETPLVKQSQADLPFHAWGDSPPQRASEVSTAEGAAPLPPRIWDRPLFLPAAESFTEANAPAWIYASRNGRNPTQFSEDLNSPTLSGGEANPDFVIGRWAYNLYETSGMIDINVAGVPSTGGPSKERASHKGSLAFADLSLVPGFSTGAADEFARWRHDWQQDSDEYIRLSEGSGWRRMAANDNLLLGRQDLLQFSRLRPDALPREALPFLTHFSRDLDAPTYRPDPERPKIIRSSAAGGNDAYRADDEVNPDLAAFDEERQRPLLHRRFPLERLKWVATPGSGGPSDPEKAERYFGLRWEQTHWEYVHGRPNGDLFTLQDVPEDREPNFFEILRATVLAGSLGRQYGARGHDDQDQKLSMHQLGRIDGSVNINIMELGACLIDQYDEDGYPTAILLPGQARPYYIFGKEDVPYLQRTTAIPFRGRQLPEVIVYKNNGQRADTEAYEASMVLQPMLWRPHQETDVEAAPTRFRIRPQHTDLLGGGSQFWLSQGWRVPGKENPPTFPPRGSAGDYTYWGGPNYRSTHPEHFPRTFTGEDYLEVTVPEDSMAFREPQSVHSPAHGAVAGYSVSGNVDPIPVRPGDLRWSGLPAGFTEVSGFLIGHAVNARIEADPMAGANSWNRLGVGFFRGDPIEVQMEYQGPDGTWRPYQRAEFTFKSNWGDHFIGKDPNWQTEAFVWSSFLIDPRTSRFGGLATVLASGQRIRDWTTLHPLMHWPEGAALAFGKSRVEGVRPGWTGPAPGTGWSYNDRIGYAEPFHQAGVAENTAVAWAEPQTFAYQDPDGVMRPGVAGWNEYNRSNFLGNPMARRYQLDDTGKLSRSESTAGRPRILNRPFRSVGELAYAFRGTPWREIDFADRNSPDAGLLDVFSLYEDPAHEGLDPQEAGERPAPVVAGRVNLNAAGPEVIAALLAGAKRDNDDYLTTAEATEMAETLVKAFRDPASGGGPILSKSELVSRPRGKGQTTGLVATVTDKFPKSEDRSIGDRREVVVRALADATTVRSWNFTLDIVAQSGRIPPAASDLQSFVPMAERRYWIHFAVDRLTGKLLDVQWERVSY